MKDNPVYKRAYFRAVRRATLENETVMKAFMDNVAANYDIGTLERLDDFLMKIADNDLFDLIMKNRSPSDFAEEYDEEIMNDIVKSVKRPE